MYKEKYNSIMNKYKVAQLCDEELHRLNSTKEDSDKNGLLRERALAVAAPETENARKCTRRMILGARRKAFR